LITLEHSKSLLNLSHVSTDAHLDLNHHAAKAHVAKSYARHLTLTLTDPVAMESSTATLPNKPGAKLALSTFAPSTPPTGALAHTLVVFLTGLGMPRASYLAAAAQLIERRRAASKPVPPLLAFDRYGQGESDPDPTDAPGSPYGHDMRSAVDDLHALLAQLAPRLFGSGSPQQTDAEQAQVQVQVQEQPWLVLVGNSIGTSIARLYAAAHPGTVAGLLLLDPMVANTDFVSLFPDPDAPAFDAAEVARNGLSAAELRHARAVTQRMFHPTVPNAERMDRRNAAALLPYADRPKLPDGPGGRAPVLVVVGHDPETFAVQNEMVCLCCAGVELGCADSALTPLVA
jgi:pimeloyl-ACP methyl ester carboxylesterase